MRGGQSGRAFTRALATTGLALCVCAGAANPPTVVSLNVALDLQDLHPAATQGAIDCGAVLQPPDWVAAHQPELTNYDAFTKWVLYPAHYLGQARSVTFPVTGRRFTGSVRADITLASPAAQPAGTPAPQAFIACWLMINGRPAVWDQSGATLLASAGNFTTVTANPLILTRASLGSPGTLSLAAKLKNQGRFFIPGPLTLSAAIQMGAAKSLASARKSAAPQLAPVALVVQSPLAAGGRFVALGSSAVSTTLSGAGAFVRPAALSLSTPLAATGQFASPSRTSVPTTLTAVGNFSGAAVGNAPAKTAAPLPIVVQAPFAAQAKFFAASVSTLNTTLTGTGGFAALANMGTNTAMAAAGHFSAPIAIVIPTTLTAGGNF
jgi:hypothetical protein